MKTYLSVALLALAAGSIASALAAPSQVLYFNRGSNLSFKLVNTYNQPGRPSCNGNKISIGDVCQFPSKMTYDTTVDYILNHNGKFPRHIAAGMELTVYAGKPSSETVCRPNLTIATVYKIHYPSNWRASAYPTSVYGLVNMANNINLSCANGKQFTVNLGSMAITNSNEYSPPKVLWATAPITFFPKY